MLRGAENPITSAGIVGLHALFRRGAITPVEAFEAFQGRAERLNSGLNAIVHWDTVEAERAAARSARRWREGAPLSLLDGAPLAIKANLAVKGLAWTGAVNAYRDHIAADDSAVVAALRAAGAVILGVANMHEAAFGATTDSPLYGRCHNPLRPGHTPGGSSGGSAAAVAAGLVAGAIGSDTLGSVRLPSAYCGVFGFKPSFGRVSRCGMRLLSYSLDHVGVHARHGRDLAPMIAAIAGRDGADPFTTALGRLAAPPSGAQAALKGLRLGAVPLEALGSISPGVGAAYERVLARLASEGVRITPVLSDFDFSGLRRHGLVVCEAEGAFLLADALAQGPDGVSPGLRKLFDYGQRVTAPRLSASQWQAAQTRSLMAGVFDRVDAVVMPTALQTAFSHEQAPPEDQADLTTLANLAGLPAASAPIGPADDGLPAGVQILAPFGADRLALAITEAFEAAGLTR